MLRRPEQPLPSSFLEHTPRSNLQYVFLPSSCGSGCRMGEIYNGKLARSLPSWGGYLLWRANALTVGISFSKCQLMLKTAVGRDYWWFNHL